MLSEHGII